MKTRKDVIDQFRQVAPAIPPMIAENMPDYEHFCKGYQRRECTKCGFFIADSGTGLFCGLWEEIFPNVVHWYTKEEVENAVKMQG